MVRYFGVFASHHHLRARIVLPAAVPAPVLQLALGLTNAANDTSGEPADVSPRPRRLAWAGLLARVFAIDVTVCRKCGGRMHILEIVSGGREQLLGAPASRRAGRCGGAPRPQK